MGQRPYLVVVCRSRATSPLLGVTRILASQQKTERQVGGILWSGSLMNARMGIPTISGDKSYPTCLKKEVM
jgi:hypothetical protein